MVWKTSWNDVREIVLNDGSIVIEMVFKRRHNGHRETRTEHMVKLNNDTKAFIHNLIKLKENQLNGF